MDPLIQLRDVSKIYGGKETRVAALSHLDLDVGRGEFLSVVGQSGSGKSTLMNLLGCLDFPTEGEYRLAGQMVSDLGDRQLSAIRNRMIGFVFQGFQLIATLNALENVELPLLYRGMGRAQRRKKALAALEQVGLAERIRHRPSELSGGQQQRVAIARAIAGDPPVLLADEPTGNLDSVSGEQVMALLTGLWRQGRTLILITHDQKVARAAPRIVRIRDGRIIEDIENRH